MYNQLIYFIVVLLIFNLQQSGKPPAVVPNINIPYILITFLFFAAYSRAVFQKIQRQASEQVFLSSISRSYHRALSRLSVMAIGWLCLYIYIFNLDVYLQLYVPGFNEFATVSGLAGLAIYFAHLAVIWYCSYPIYRTIHSSEVSRFRFIRGHLSFNMVILIPWLLISIVLDLLQLIKMPSFFSSGLGEVVLIALAMIGFVLLGPWLIVRLWRCEPLPSDSRTTEIERYCSEHGFRVGGFYLWPLFGGEMLTAGIVGILPGLRYILITSGLLRILDISEIKAVVAHEMGHVRKKHLLLFVLLFILFMVLVYSVSDTAMLLLLSNRTVLEWVLSSGFSSSTLISFFTSISMVIFMVLYFRFIFGFFLRNCERQADLYAMELLGSPLPLVSSFEKIAYHSGRIEDVPSWHHFSIRQRIQFLLAAFENRALIRKHNRRLYSWAITFIVIVSALSFAGIQSNQSKTVKNWANDIQLGIVEQQLAKQPENTQIQAAYGGILFERGRYSEAESVWRAALGHDPQNSTILNNLAWLYATSPPPHRKPAEALRFALKAADIDPVPHVLDTLAEAYYANGRYEDAIDTIEEALIRQGAQPEKGADLTDYFLQQKEKFEKALRNEESKVLSGPGIFTQKHRG